MIAWWQNPCNITPSYCIFVFVLLIYWVEFLYLFGHRRKNSRVIKQSFFLNVYFSQTQRLASAYILFLSKQTGDLSHVIKVTAVFFKANPVFKCFLFFPLHSMAHMMRKLLSTQCPFFPLIMSSWKGVDREGRGANGDILWKAKAAQSSKKLGSIHSLGWFCLALLTPSGEMSACLSMLRQRFEGFSQTVMLQSTNAVTRCN